MQMATTLTLATLPDEILQAIFLYLDARTLLGLGATARRFLALSNDTTLWKRYCQAEYRYWDSSQPLRELLRDTSQDWKQIYADRHFISQSTQSVLSELVKESTGRSDRISVILEHGYKAKDTLLQVFKASSTTADHLAERYWSHVVLGCLHRTIALDEWTRIKYRTDIPNPTERSLAAFDMFILDQQEVGDIDDIFNRLDSYVSEIRSVYPDIDEQTPRTKAMTIAAHMRERRWIGIDRGREYHSLDNMFLGVALFSSHRNSLPLISAVIYSYVARQFNLQAQPLNYPMHVHVLVQPLPGIDVDGNPHEHPTTNSPQSTQTHLYMDPWHSIEPISYTSLRDRLGFIASQTSMRDRESFMSPATHRDLTIRTAHNTLHSRNIDQHSMSHPISADAAIYASYFALVLFPSHPASLRTALSELAQHFISHFDHDLSIFRSYILPLTTNLPDHLAYRNLSLQLLHNDLEPPTPKLRSLIPNVENPVRYRVGQLFRHRRRNYLALIYGWDSTCEMPAQWITMNQVDRLPRGRNQPFYSVLVIDDRSKRYVAEENVVLLGPADQGGNGETVGVQEVLGWPIEIGKWMRRFVLEEGGDGEESKGWRFESNVRDQFPED